MEDSSVVDMGLRNVAVRLNDSNVSNEINGGCVNSIYMSSSIDKETKLTHFSEECDQNCSSNLPDIASELRDKLHVCRDSSNCDLLNGCSKLLHDDIKRVDLSINGINKCNVELLNTRLDKLNIRTCVEHTSSKIDKPRTEFSTTENDSKKCNDKSYSSIKHTLDDRISSHQVKESTSEVDSRTIPDETGKELSIRYLGYESELQMPDIMRLIQKDLSEPYSIYTYRYFIHNWPKLCFLAQDGSLCVGAIVCKLDVHKKQSRRGYIAMLAVDEKYRKRKIGSNLVLKAIQAMVQDNADEVVLETEITNKSALRLYENLGFVRDKRLFRYYLNGVDALRLKLWLR